MGVSGIVRELTGQDVAEHLRNGDVALERRDFDRATDRHVIGIAVDFWATYRSRG
jgi:hypothetical protein